MRDALGVWQPVWVVVDGSTDGSAALLAPDADLRVIVSPCNEGKGAAVLRGLRAAEAAGFTHVLTLDADGQHHTPDIARMMALAASNPRAMVLGTPIFDAEAPRERVVGRRFANFLARMVTGDDGIEDCLYGMRVYPVAPLLEAFAATRWMRRYDFDAEAAIRLCRAGVRPINLPTPVRYFSTEQGGVSHYRYVRDNLVLGCMFTRLLFARRRRVREAQMVDGGRAG